MAVPHRLSYVFLGSLGLPFACVRDSDGAADFAPTAPCATEAPTAPPAPASTTAPSAHPNAPSATCPISVQCASDLPGHERIRATVTSLADGDSFMATSLAGDPMEVRMQGIDAPEGRQVGGEAARASLASLILNREVTITWKKRDTYQRYLAYVAVAAGDACATRCDAIDVGASQIAAGQAWYYRHYERDVTRAQAARFDWAETTAKAAKLGLWAEANPQPPWEWRQAHR